MLTVTGAPVPGKATIHDLSRQLVNDDREILPVANADGQVFGGMKRAEALDVIFGDGE